jgi:hypothetical protein
VGREHSLLVSVVLTCIRLDRVTNFVLLCDEQWAWQKMANCGNSIRELEPY